MNMQQILIHIISVGLVIKDKKRGLFFSFAVCCMYCGSRFRDTGDGFSDESTRGVQFTDIDGEEIDESIDWGLVFRIGETMILSGCITFYYDFVRLHYSPLHGTFEIHSRLWPFFLCIITPTSLLQTWLNGQFWRYAILTVLEFFLVSVLVVMDG